MYIFFIEVVILLFEFIAMFVLFLLLFDPDFMILFGDRSLLLNLAVLLRIFVFSKKSMILFVCPFRCFPFSSLKMSSMFKL